MELDLFLNDNFKVLECLCNNEVTLQGNTIVRLSQDEMAKELCMSKSKINGILHLFENRGLIEMAGAGKYLLKDNARVVYRCLKEITGSEE